MDGLYHYTDCGLPNVWLDGGVTYHETPYGGGTSIMALDELHDKIAMGIIAQKGMTGAEMRFLRIELDLSQRALAGMLDTSEKNIQRWEKNRDRQVPSGPACVALCYTYGAVRENPKVSQLIQSMVEIDREISELEHRMSFRMDGEHWKRAS